MAPPILDSHKSPDAIFDDIDLIGVFQSLWRRRTLILGSTLGIAVLAYAISFAVPKVFKAEVAALPVGGADQFSSMAFGMASQMGIPPGVAGSLGGVNKTADLIEVLGSQTMAKRVIAKCGLEKEIEGWKFKEDLVKDLRLRTKVSGPGLKNNAIRVSVTAENPELASRIANAYMDELKGILDELGYNRASKHRKFLEAQLHRTKGELTIAEQSVTNYQAKNRIASIPEAVASSIKSLSDLEAKRVTTEIQESSAGEILGTMASKVAGLQADPNALLELQLQRKGLAAQREAVGRAQSEFQQRLQALPPKAMALARLQRDVQVLNAIFLAMSQQLEAAIISENKESDSFIVLDRADVPERHTWPIRRMFALIGAAIGLLLGCIWAQVMELRQRPIG